MFFLIHDNHDILWLEVSVNEPHIPKVLNDLHELFHDQGGFVLFQESVAFDVLKKITLTQILSHDIQVGPGVENLMQLQDVGMMAEFQDVTLWFKHVFLVEGKLKLFNYLDCDFFTRLLRHPFEHWGIIALTNFLCESKTIIHTHGLVLLQVAHPFVSQHFWLKNKPLLRVNTVPVLHRKSKLTLINLIHRKPLHVNYTHWLVRLWSAQNEKCCFAKIHILVRSLTLLSILTHALNPRRVVPELRHALCLVELPNISMKPFEVRVENRLMCFYQFEKIVKAHLLCSSVQSKLFEKISCVLADQRRNVWSHNVLFAFSFNFWLSYNALELLLLSFSIFFIIVIHLLNSLALLEF